MSSATSKELLLKPFTTHRGIVAPIDRANIDTDAIVPKQFLRKIERTGFGVHLFHEWRYLDYEGTKENAGFVLNQGPYREATILLTRDNFGCGSSREHAPWALSDFGFRVIVAPSFADIFYNNCIKNGILCVTLDTADIDKLFKQAKESPGIEMTADLSQQIFIDGSDNPYAFHIDSFAKTCLIKGLDQIGWTQQFEDNIKNFELKNSQDKPWLNRS